MNENANKIVSISEEIKSFEEDGEKIKVQISSNKKIFSASLKEKTPEEWFNEIELKKVKKKRTFLARLFSFIRG